MNVTLVKTDSPKGVRSVFKLGILSWVPLGLLSVAGSVKDQADTKIVDLATGDVLSKELLVNTDVLGIGASTKNFNRAIEILKRAKLKNPKIKTVLGGPHITLQPKDAEKCNDVDHIIIGEGEIAFPKIVSGEVTDRIVKEPPIENLDDLPYPAYELIDMSKYHFLHLSHWYMIETSRGCPFDCSFCAEKKLLSPRYRTKSVKRVIDELKFFKPKLVMFADSNFAGNPKHSMDLCDAMIDANVNQAIYMGNIRVDTIVKHPTLVRKMADAGFGSFFVGIESPFNKTLESFKKGISWEQTKRAKQILDQNDIVMMADLIIGSLEETEEDITKYVKLVRTLDIDLFDLTILTPFPGTEVFEKIDELRFVEDWEYYDAMHCVFRHPSISFQKMHQLHIETVIRLWYDPVSMGKRLLKILKFCIKNFEIINELLDYKKLFKSFFLDAPLFYFWNSNKYIRRINRIFTEKLKAHKGEPRTD